MIVLIVLSIFWVVLVEGVEIISFVMFVWLKSYIVFMVRDVKFDIFVNSYGWFFFVFCIVKV